MIQDIAPHIFKNQYIEDIAAKPDDCVLTFNKKGVLIDCGASEDKLYPTVKQYIDAGYESNELIYLFALDDKEYFMPKPEIQESIVIPGFSEYKGMHSLRELIHHDGMLVAATGWHLFNWYDTTRFCGRCGKKLIHVKKERAMRCEACGNQIYPKISPAVIIAVTNGDKILLSKYANREYTRYALLAGFCEIGEEFEETVKREVMEETGLKVKNIRYYKSQPWGFDGIILAGFFCELDGDENITLDEEELSVAEWVKKEDVPTYDEKISLTHEMMVVFKNK